MNAPTLPAKIDALGRLWIDDDMLTEAQALAAVGALGRAALRCEHTFPTFTASLAETAIQITNAINRRRQWIRAQGERA